MIFLRSLFLYSLVVLLSTATALRSMAEDAPAPAATAAASELDNLRKALSDLESSSLEAPVKESLKKKYDEAISQLESAFKFEKESADLRAAIDSGPSETEALRQALSRGENSQRLPKLPDQADSAMIDALLISERARLAEFGRKIREWEELLTTFETRPAENREEITTTTRLLSEAEEVLSTRKGADKDSPDKVADLAVAQTRVRMLRSQLEMLQAETLSFAPRRDLTEVKLTAIKGEQETAKERVSELETRQKALVSERIHQSEELISGLALDTLSDDSAVKPLIKESRDLAKRNQALLGSITRAEAAHKHAEEELNRLRRESEDIRAQIGIGGLEESFSEIILDLRRTLPTSQSLRSEISERRRLMSTSQLEAFRASRELSKMPSQEGQAEEILDLLRVEGIAEETLSKLRPGLLEFVANRSKLRQDYLEANRRLSFILGETDLLVSETLSVSEDLSDFLSERLIWVASSPPLGKNAFTGVRTSLLALAGPEALAEYTKAIKRIDLGQWFIALFLTLILLIPRRRLRSRLASTALRTRYISQDHIGNTFIALGISLWLALPLPTLLAFFGHLFANDPAGNGTIYALGKGLAAPAYLFLMLRFASILCWPNGVAEAHFRWRREALDRLHRTLMSMMYLYLPGHILLTIWWHNSSDLAAFQGPGRLVFILEMLAVAVIMGSYFRRAPRLFPTPANTVQRFEKVRQMWRLSLVLLPIAVAVAAALGHFLSAVTIAWLFQKTTLVLLAGLLVSALLTRWAALRGRRMALADILAQREAKRAAQENPPEESPTPGDLAQTEHFEVSEEDEPLDLAVVGEQARDFIRIVVTLLTLLGCWFALSGALPALKHFDSLTLFGSISLTALLWTILVAVITWIVVLHLPALLELGFLRALDLESGVRNAIVTLCQYVTVAIGAALAFQSIGLNWASFGWIAAALSVGLGFGLQEVVANFVSGLILLFERPIRVGDIVTVGGVDGVVSRIRIRATTIINADKKEFIVPNKDFITGRILNWTLSNSMNRLVFPIDVAYGSDIHKVRDLLLSIAEEQPEVLTDPAPAAVFEEFSDSSLRFSLRCYLGSTGQRLEVTHRINTLIHDRFAEHDIEIPYPQHELRVRSLPKGMTLPENTTES